MAAISKATAGCEYDHVSIGYPGPVIQGRPVTEPFNLGRGWVGFNFEKALGRPVKVINDAAMQALGSYQGGRMLFLGLGTGLGSAFIVDGRLNHLNWRISSTARIALMKISSEHARSNGLGRTIGHTTLLRSSSISVKSWGPTMLSWAVETLES